MKKLIVNVVCFFPIIAVAQSQIYEANSNVGISNSNPQYKLDVTGKINATDQVHFRNNIFVYNSSAVPTITLKNDNGETANPANGAVISGSAYGGAIRFGNNFTNTGGTYRYLQLGRINNSNTFTPIIYLPSESLNVGIGISSPTEKLHVSGNILATGKIYIGTVDVTKTTPYILAVNGSAVFTQAVVKSYANWPDYVFTSNYKLPSLQSIESFIKTYKHLPDIPSSDDINRNGIDLGNNQGLLLKKIEELTLYIIEQNKKIQELQGKAISQSKKINLLSDQILDLENKILKK